MNRKAPFMGTTEVPAERSIQSICGLLASAGARQINQSYDGAGKVTGISWTMDIKGQQVAFSLPARVDACFEMILSRRASKPRGQKELETLRIQANRVAWRQIFRWVEAQIAMVQTGMVETGEVFSPYLIDSQGRTMWQLLTEQKFLQIEGGK